MEPVVLADGVDVGNDVKGESKGDAEVWGPRPRWMDGGVTYQDRGSPGEACWGSLIRSSVPAMLSLGCLLDLPEGHGVGINTKTWGSRERSRLESSTLSHEMRRGHKRVVGSGVDGIIAPS